MGRARRVRRGRALGAGGRSGHGGAGQGRLVLPKRVQEPGRGRSRAGDAVAAGAGCAAGRETSGGRGEECAPAVEAARVDAGALVGGRARALSGRRAPRRGQRLGPRCWLANFL